MDPISILGLVAGATSLIDVMMKLLSKITDNAKFRLNLQKHLNEFAREVQWCKNDVSWAREMLKGKNNRSHLDNTYRRDLSGLIDTGREMGTRYSDAIKNQNLTPNNLDGWKKEMASFNTKFNTWINKASWNRMDDFNKELKEQSRVLRKISKSVPKLVPQPSQTYQSGVQGDQEGGQKKGSDVIASPKRNKGDVAISISMSNTVASGGAAKTTATQPPIGGNGGSGAECSSSVNSTSHNRQRRQIRNARGEEDDIWELIADEEPRTLALKQGHAKAAAPPKSLHRPSPSASQMPNMPSSKPKLPPVPIVQPLFLIEDLLQRSMRRRKEEEAGEWSAWNPWRTPDFD